MENVKVHPFICTCLLDLVNSNDFIQKLQILNYFEPKACQYEYNFSCTIEF